MSEIEIDKYLFNEMTETEREHFEDSFLSDHAIFYEIAERENGLVDRYVRGGMSGSEFARFERGLAGLPARRQKIANAKILREFVADERVENKTITIAERSSIFARLFSFGPAIQFASVGAILILGLVSVFLWSENRQLGSLQQELTESRQRETELSTQIESERETSGDLTADLEAERERRVKLEADIARLGSAAERPLQNRPAPTIATLVLSSIGIRGGGASPVRRLQLAHGVTRVSLVIGLPEESKSDDRVSIILNGQRVAENLKLRTRGEERIVTITLPTSKTKPGRNELIVRDTKDAVLATYSLDITHDN